MSPLKTEDRGNVECALRTLRSACVSLAKRLDDDDRDPPLRGHCVEVAFAVRAILGGVIVGRFVPCGCEPGCEGTDHYWNRLADGREYDLTSDQFGGDGMYPCFEGATEKFTPITPIEHLGFIMLLQQELSVPQI